MLHQDTLECVWEQERLRDGEQCALLSHSRDLLQTWLRVT